ncbi:hypothetical protein [Isoptericola rhizosphaerae]|uniref:hypothetical protein n=1 Tax=Isoptericola rhizosphaerae TaxID=3377837 RepID=UPI00383B3571
MTEIYRVQYTTAGVAAGDLSNWSAVGINVVARTSPPRLQFDLTAGTGRSVSRTLTGLTPGAEYTVNMGTDLFNYAEDFEVTVGGTSAFLIDGFNAWTFTATSTTEDLLFDFTDTAYGTEYVNFTALWVVEVLPPVDPNEPDPIEVTNRPSHLRDTIEIVTPEATYDEGTDTWSYDWGTPTVVATLPAYVGYTAASLELEPGRAAFIESLRVITAAFNFQPTKHRIRWKGETYLPDGPALVRNRGNRAHHLTIPIKAVTG